MAINEFTFLVRTHWYDPVTTGIGTEVSIVKAPNSGQAIADELNGAGLPFNREVTSVDVYPMNVIERILDNWTRQSWR